MTRGIRPVPIGVEPALRAHLNDMRQVVLKLQGAQEPPGPVVNLAITPLPGGNLLQWTTVDADYYQILWGNSPDISKATQAFVGPGNQYADIFGAVATRWYWVWSLKNNGQRSVVPAGPVSGMSGALVTAVIPPIVPPPGDPLVIDERVGYPIPRGPIRIGG
jgi:hypothetical protein